MKKGYSYFLWMALLSFLYISCDKDSMNGTTSNSTSPLFKPSILPQAHAGIDIWVDLPSDTIILTGANIAFSTPPHQYEWKQLRGANHTSIQNRDSLRTRIYNFTEGTYEFELTVTDAMGFKDKDSIQVFVQDPAFPGKNVVLLKGITWICPMGCTLVIDCLSCYIPMDKSFKVYVKELITYPWTEAVTREHWSESSQYMYSVNKNQLVLYTNYEMAEKADIKIVY